MVGVDEHIVYTRDNVYYDMVVTEQIRVLEFRKKIILISLRGPSKSALNNCYVLGGGQSGHCNFRMYDGVDELCVPAMAHTTTQ